MISTNIRILFDGNHANIPAGFVRDTTFDGRFPKGVASGFGDTGGAATHTHGTTNNHTHTVNAHSHTYTTANFSGNGDTTNNDGSNWQDHTHTGTSGGLDNTYTSAAANPDWSAASNLPPNYKFIAIKSTGFNLIPVNGCVFSQTDLTNLTAHAASNGKIASIAATGANAGDGGGSTTHAHTFAHDHGNIAHNHSAANSDLGSGNGCGSTGTANDHASANHIHSTSFTAANAATVANTTSYDFTGIEPKNYGLKILKNETAASVSPKVGVIAMTTESTIPANWIICDGNNDTPDLSDYYVKNTTVDLTAGANAHTHSQAHTHAISAHTHPFSTATSNTPGYGGTGPDQSDKWSYQHNHGTGTTASGGNGTSGSGTINAVSASNEPPYIKVAFIKLIREETGGAFLFNFI